MRIARQMVLMLAALSLVGCLTVGLGPLSIGPPANSGLPLLYADPGVSILRADGNRVGYEPGMVLLQGDTISTKGGQAVIDFDDGHIVALQSNTHIQLGSIRLFFGELFARMETLVQRGGARVETDELTASVEGTEFAVKRAMPRSSRDDGRSSVIVRRGQVRCDPVPQAAWDPVVLQPDEQFAVLGWRGTPRVRRVDAFAETRWADAAIRRLLVPRSNAPSVGVQIPIGGTASGHESPKPKYDDY
ncbi:MAG: FecR domain-containing protein [Gammaproteobacteria bacterium]|nr:FecR domain-containing protein [Gammaproteobacteria bacterium]